MATPAREGSFPSPFEIETPPGCEGWEEMYPYHALFHEARRDAEFTEREAHEARMRTERVMMERVHEIPRVKSRRLKEPSNRVKRIGTLAKQTRETMVF